MVETIAISKVTQFGTNLIIQGDAPNGYGRGLNLGAGTLASPTTRLSNIIQLSGKALVECLIKLASGDMTLKFSVFDVDGDADFGSPDLTLTSSDTDYHFDKFELAYGKLLQVQLTSTAGGVWEEGFIRPIQTDLDYRVLSGGWCAVNADTPFPDYTIVA